MKTFTAFGHTWTVIGEYPTKLKCQDETGDIFIFNRDRQGIPANV